MGKIEVKIKYVKKASQWCLTHFNKKGDQIQKWFRSEEEAEAYKDFLKDHEE